MAQPNLPPPLSLPALHFGAALAWLLLAAGLLPFVAPRLAHGLVFDPIVIAFVHVTMLGAMLTAVFGTLTQFLPGGLGVPIKNLKASYLGFWLLQLGIAALVTGFWTWRGAYQGIGWLLTTSGLVCHSINTLRVRHSTNAPQTAQFVIAAHIALMVAIVLAALRISETLGWWHINRLYLLASHALLAAVGFGTLMTMGVGSRMLPMFLAAPGDDRRWLSVQLSLTGIGLLLFVSGAILSKTVIMRLGGYTLTAAGLTAVLIVGKWLSRKRRPFDAALRLIAVAAGALAAAEVLWLLVVTFYPLSLHRWAAAFLMLLLGWLITLIFGVMSRVLPNLTYVNLVSESPRIKSAGSATNLLVPFLLNAAAIAATIGLPVLVVGIWNQSSSIALVGSVFWAISVIAIAANYTRLLIMGLAR